MIEDDTNEPPKADPMAAARAAKARKQAEKAEAELKAAEAAAQATPADDEAGPMINTLQGRAEQLDEGPDVDMIVTFKGHGQISTGGVFGFERRPRKSRFKCPEKGARDLFNKGWAEPVDERYADRWNQMNAREQAASARRATRERHVLEHGINADETWRTGIDG